MIKPENQEFTRKPKYKYRGVGNPMEASQPVKILRREKWKNKTFSNNKCK